MGIFRMAVLLGFGLLLLALGQSLAQQSNFKNFSVGDGLAQSQVFTMLQDSRGFIWMGTRGGGINKFDGQKFVSFTEADGLSSNYTICGVEDGQNNLWIGTDNGLNKYDGRNFEYYAVREEDQLPVTAIASLDDVNYWIGTTDGIYRFDGVQFEKVLFDSPFRQGLIACFFQDSKGQWWIGGDAGLGKVEGDSIRHFNTRNSLSENLVRSIAEDDSGRIWVGTYGGGINILDGDEITVYSLETGLPDDIILTMMRDRDGKMWIGSQNGGVCYWEPKDSSFQCFSEDDGLCNNHIRVILQDLWGNIWLGSSGGGISQYSGRQFIHFTESDGLAGKYVYSVIEDHRGRMWMGASAKGVTVMDSNRVTHLNADSGFMDTKVKAIFEDRSGKIWLGTEGEGVFVMDTDRVHTFNTINGLSGAWIRDITQDSLGHMWIATASGGITKIEQNKRFKKLKKPQPTYRFKYFNRQNGSYPNRINCLHIDRKNRVWFASADKGVGCIAGDTLLMMIDQRKGLIRNAVRTLAEDDHGNLWAGTAGGGVNRITIYEDSLQFDTLTTREGLHSGNIYLLLVDNDQHLWVGTESGVDQVWLDRTSRVLDIKHYGKAEGFVGIETCQNAAFKDRSGNLWFGTINGLTQYNPSTNIKNTLAPILSITRATLFYEPLENTIYAPWVGKWGEVRDGMELPYDQNHLSFEFTGVNFKNPENVLYQWKMDGLEEDWSPVSGKRDATYSNIPPGQYTFMVKACNEDGVWCVKPETVSFTILPPIWQTWWFITAAIAAGLLILVVTFRIRLNQVKQKIARDRERLEMEKNLLQLEQKALRLQMNPHFIFNALNSIQGLIVQQDAKKARYYLAKFSSLMRLILESTRTGSITLEDEIKTLSHYLSIEQFSKEHPFDFEILSPDEIDAAETMIPPMLIQPFVENAIIHGFSNIDYHGKITISFSVNGKFMTCTVTDNGIGRKKAAQQKSQVGQQHKSTALAVTQERLDILNTSTAKINSLQIVDLEEADGSAAGTRVTIKIPLAEG